MSNDTKKVLILEDQPLIAFDVEDSLVEAGFTQLTLFSSCEDGEKWLQTNTPAVAIIDIKLRDGKCENIAQILVDRDIPFVVHTGSSSPEDEASVFKHGKWISKPSSPESIIDVVQDILGCRLPLTKQA